MSAQGNEQQGVPVGQMDAMDQAAYQDAQALQTYGNVLPFGGLGISAAATAEIAEIQGRAAKKTELAQMMDANTRMVVDPEQVDELARFFEDKAEELGQRLEEVSEQLSRIEPPGGDPTSRGVAKAFGEVGMGGGQGYLENYQILVRRFQEMADGLRKQSQQVRTDDQNASDAFRDGLNA